MLISYIVIINIICIERNYKLDLTVKLHHYVILQIVSLTVDLILRYIVINYIKVHFHYIKVKVVLCIVKNIGRP